MNKEKPAAPARATSKAIAEPDNITLIIQTLHHSNKLQIVNGILEIEPANKAHPEPDKQAQEINRFLQVNHKQLVSGIAQALSMRLLIFEYHDTKPSRVRLYFLDTLTGELVRCFCNAQTHRTRTSKHGKKGEPLPPKQFNPPEHGALMALWVRTGLEIPKRANLFDYMGNLSAIVLSGQISSKGQIQAKDLHPVTISDAAIRAIFAEQLPSKPAEQLPSNCRASKPPQPINYAA